jgi:predicted RNA-binding Zn-ribbon protein involved in translation (DUF1610 family)
MFENLQRELRAIEQLKQVTVPLATDDKGYLDKECPAQGCEFLFKVNEQDWINICRDEAVWCPMCGHSSPAKHWYTKEQVAHGKREALKMIQGRINSAMRADASAFNRQQPKNAFISMSMNVSGSHFSTIKVPAAAMEAMQLEIECEACTARFAVIGSAYFCPACGHNSVHRMFQDSLRKISAKKDNIELIRTALLAQGLKDQAELACRSLIESCLLDGVTGFQKYLDGLYHATPGTSTPPFNAFQRLGQGSALWRAAIGIGYEGILDGAQLTCLGVLFQKRHILAHSDGIVDARYVKESGDTTYKEGQRIAIWPNDVDDMVASISKLAAEIRKASGV